MWREVLIFLCIVSLGYCQIITEDELIDEVPESYSIVGRVYPPDTKAGSPFLKNWQLQTKVSINGGEYCGFLRIDGSFVISGVPSGSYVVEVHNPYVVYEPVRVEINNKGKFRARRVNYLALSQVVPQPYPLKLQPIMPYKYFQVREQWRITDFMMNPMVLMMVLPLLLMLVLPKMINDPETKKELENMQFPKVGGEMPEFSEMLTSLLTGKPIESAKPKPAIAAKQNKKRN